MDRVSILEFRRHAEAIIRKVQQGKRLIVTYRGKPVMRLEPIRAQQISPEDPFYSLDQLAVADGEALTNEEIDQIVYQD
jgi:prevent-host-death family protein